MLLIIRTTGSSAYNSEANLIAEALELPGVMCYGQTRDEAIGNVERLAVDVIADRVAHRELLPSSFGWVRACCVTTRNPSV